VQDHFEALVAPNFPVRTKLFSFDWLFYGFGFFLLILPFLPFPNLKFAFLLFYLFFFVGVFTFLSLADLKAFLSRRIKSLSSQFIFNLKQTKHRILSAKIMPNIPVYWILENANPLS